jgi:large subunit ribosomal protein L15
MQLHDLRPVHKPKRRKRVGRGGKRGTYSGKGLKGQKSRAGRKMKPFIRELIKRYPKVRGYKFGSKTKKRPIVVLNLETLEKKFGEGQRISPGELLQKGIIDKIKGRIPVVKILGKGQVKKKLVVENCLISGNAREKIEKAGGTIK